MNQHLKNKKKRQLLKGTDKYDKITYRDKIMLLKRVVVDDEQIKQTSHHLNINYSTAKTFLRKFKNKSNSLNTEFIESVCKWFAAHETVTERCSYRVVVHDTETEPVKTTLSDMVKEEFQNTSDTLLGKQLYAGVSNKKGQIKIIQQVMFE